MFSDRASYPAHAWQRTSIVRVSHPRFFIGAAVPLAGAVLSIWIGRAEATDANDRSVASVAATPADPHQVLTVDACVKCHPSEVDVWQRTPHAQTFEQLHRRPEAKQIAQRLGIRSIKHEDRCVACHYTQQANTGGIVAVSGVSCESCHGAAKNWIDGHHDYGGHGITRLTEPPAHRDARITAAVIAGMRNPRNVYQMAQSCYRCHTVQDESLVNMGGHSAGSLDFELVSWSQGMIRHNFAHSDGVTNRARAAAELRVMFVAGMIADLEASLRAVALATENDSYGVNAAQRAARAAARLRSVTAKIDSDVVDQVLDVFAGLQLRLGNSSPLVAAADQIASLGYQFADRSDGGDLEPLDPFIPAIERWK